MAPKLWPLVLLVLGGCASAPVSMARALDVCARGASSVEVLVDGQVARVLGTFVSRSGAHEGFIVRSGDMQLRVENNDDITGAVPLSKGEAITLQGQYECGDGVIHWTHHDPRGRHVSGFIQAGGKIYR